LFSNELTIKRGIRSIPTSCRLVWNSFQPFRKHSGRGSSQSNLDFKIFCIKTFAVAITGPIKPRGSKSLFIADNISRLVDALADICSINCNSSEAGFHSSPRVRMVSLVSMFQFVPNPKVCHAMRLLNSSTIYALGIRPQTTDKLIVPVMFAHFQLCLHR